MMPRSLDGELTFVGDTEGDPPKLTPRKIKGLGWKPDLPDSRDRVFDHPRVLRKLRGRVPSSIDLRTTPAVRIPVLDQENLGSCTANATASVYDFIQQTQGAKQYTPSRLFLYYGSRELENSIPYDDGAYIRDALKVAGTLGCPPEATWPYVIGRFTQRPPAVAYTQGETHQALIYQRVKQESVAVKLCLAAGHPIVLGFSVHPSFYSIGAQGFMPVPGPTERVDGGHAVSLFGYKRMKAPWDRYAIDYGIFLNSWAEDWGAAGWFYAPLRWMLNNENADDFWTIVLAEE